MSLFTLLGGATVRPNLEQRASRLFDAIVWRALLGVAILFLGLAFWRVLEHEIGPILAPLAMAGALSVAAAVFAFIDARRKRRIKATTPPIAPIVATLLEIAFAPKLVRWFAIGSLVVDVLTGDSPLTNKGQPQRRSRL